MWTCHTQTGEDLEEELDHKDFLLSCLYIHVIAHVMQPYWWHYSFQVPRQWLYQHISIHIYVQTVYLSIRCSFTMYYSEAFLFCISCNITRCWICLMQLTLLALYESLDPYMLWIDLEVKNTKGCWHDNKNQSNISSVYLSRISFERYTDVSNLSYSTSIVFAFYVFFTSSQKVL